jgi:cephalosporin-C deacetylase
LNAGWLHALQALVEVLPHGFYVGGESVYLDGEHANGIPKVIQAVTKIFRSPAQVSHARAQFTRALAKVFQAALHIASRPDWDGKTIVALGTSMGGHQSLVAAGLNPKITAVIVNEPSGADSNGDLHGRRSGYPNWPSDNSDAMRTALYFDTVNFAPRIKAPALAAVGFIDTVCPPAGVWTAVNQISGPTEVVPMIESDHNNLTPQKQGAWNSRSKEVLDLILTGGEFRPNSHR